MASDTEVLGPPAGNTAFSPRCDQHPCRMAKLQPNQGVVAVSVLQAAHFRDAPEASGIRTPKPASEALQQVRLAR